MAYLLENNISQINTDIFKRKEYYQYKIEQDFEKNNFDEDELSNDDSEDLDINCSNKHHDFEKPKKVNINIIPRFFIDAMIKKNNYLQFQSYQKFVSNYINPNTPYTRLLMKWKTGTGKSIGALSIALNFIKFFQRNVIDDTTLIGSVFIIGFTAHVFINELLRFPEFGIITRDELNILNNLKKIAYDGNNSDREAVHEFLLKIKKRLNNRINNGFFQFIGYKKLVNRLFIISDSKIDISKLDENGIKKAIDAKKITINLQLLDEFKNSLVICDEIHNVYNSFDKNNWGIALQYILNSHKSIRALFMSATPINNKPGEIVDLLNLLLPHTYYPNNINRSDLFTADNELKHGSLDKISNLCKGRISYVNSNPKKIPTKKFIGECIPGISYLKFIRCPMSELHYNTYTQWSNRDKTDSTVKLSQDGQYLNDFVIPNPNNDKIGMYQTIEIKKNLQFASDKWKTENKINFIDDIIVGDILQLKYLSKISTKYAKMIEILNNIILNRGGKVFIYHNIIHMSGVLFIQEVLLQNYIIGEHDISTENTLCVTCGKMKKEHAVTGGGVDHITANNLHNKLHDITVKFNSTMDVYEIYDGHQHIMEYYIYDDIVIIECKFIDINYFLQNSSKIYDIINTLGQTTKILIHLSNDNFSNQLVKELNYTLYYENYYISDSNYFADQNLSNQNLSNQNLSNQNLSKQNLSDAKDLINHIEHRSKNPNYITRQNIKIGGNKQSQKKNLSDDKKHTFMPVRFIAVHSDLDRRTMNASIEKYNSPDNSKGYRIMILIGGKIVKEAYDIKAVRELLVMSRPDNIPTLIQIIGRTIRQNSHQYLQKHNRHVNIRIFTSCLPNKKNGVYEMSYEENKYSIKIQHYKIIQKIEMVMHENAVDAIINKNIIWPKSNNLALSKKNQDLDILYYEPNYPKKMINHTFTLNELNLQTFNIFHANEEVNNIILIIKKLFIERSPAWTFKDLLYAVKNSRSWMNVEFNPNLINDELFIIALSRLLWTYNTTDSNNQSYIEPLINQHSHNSKNIEYTIIDRLFDSDDKIIITPGNQKSIIVQIGDYYIMLPYDDILNEPIKNAEFQYRINNNKEDMHVNLKQMLEVSTTSKYYENKKSRFFTKWNSVEIEKMEIAICDFGLDFHIMFLEECIKYIFNVWTNRDVKKSYMHQFYFKMIAYYDLRKVVIWGHTTKPFIFKLYEKILKPVTVNLKNNRLKIKTDAKTDNNESDANTSGLLNLLKSSINNSDADWVSTGMIDEFNVVLSESLKLFDGEYKKHTSGVRKVDADKVPIGHFLNIIPKFYTPVDGWFESPEYLNGHDDFIENTILIGYDERSKTGIHNKFKIRKPIQNIKQFKDTRLIEKGTVCTSKDKLYLKKIAHTLGIVIKGRINVSNLCNEIRTKLIYFELKERIAKTKIKYFYFIYENRPDIIS